MGIVALIGLFLFYCLACLCLGDAVIFLLTRQSPDRATDGALSPGLTALAAHFLLGQGLLGSIWLLGALAAVFTPVFIVAVLLLCILIRFRFARHTLLDARRHLVRILTDAQTESLGWRLITILAPVLLFLSLFRAFTLPSWDGTTLYLSFPKIVAATQRLVPLPGYEHFVATLGSQGEMHFAALMALSDDTSAHLFTWPTSSPSRRLPCDKTLLSLAKPSATVYNDRACGCRLCICVSLRRNEPCPN